MKYLLPMMLMSSIALGAPSVNEVESLIQNKQYTQAEVALESVVAEQPQSAKAHYYLGQIYKINGNASDAKTEMKQYYNLRTEPSKVIQESHSPTITSSFLLGIGLILFGLALIVVGIFHIDEIKSFIHQKWNAKDIAKQKQKRKDELLRRCNSSKSKVRSAISLLKVHGMQHTDSFLEMNEYSNALTDAIECLTKDSDCKLRAIESMLNDFDCAWTDVQLKLP